MAIRVTQIPTQSAQAPSDTRLRVTQLAAESAQLPTDTRLRTTQLVLLIAEGARRGFPVSEGPWPGAVLA